MQDIIFFIIGLAIGWNFPQPGWAKTLQAKYLQKWIDKLKAMFTFFK